MTILTPLQFEIARLHASGLPMREVAKRAGTTYGSVRACLPKIRDRLGARTRPAIARALQDAEARPRGAMTRPARSGFRPGDTVRFVSGPNKGREGIYLRTVNNDQWYVRINGARIAVVAKHIQPKEQA
jgi:DNA-binding CsgD family transcriptional regulator